MLYRLDGAAVRRWWSHAVDILGVLRTEIDALNVFPVADADTGTNLYRTLHAGLPSGDDDADDLRATARRCVLHACGSSGAILGAFLTGLAGAAHLPWDGARLADALARGAAAAYGAVAEPVAGTMLSVLQAAAHAAADSAEAGGTVADVSDAAVDAARTALLRTPEELPVLRAAGVVDAGGCGVLVICEALRDVVHDRDGDRRPGRMSMGQLLGVDREFGVDRERLSSGAAGTAACGVRCSGDLDVEVMYTWQGTEENAAALRADLQAIGADVVLAGLDGVWQVHVHTAHPDQAIAAGSRNGVVSASRITGITAGEAVSDDEGDPAPGR